VSIILANFLALAKWLGNWAVAALIFSSGSIEGEGGLVTTAFEDWGSIADWLHAFGISIETALERVEALVPLTLIFRESSGELKIALADASSARTGSVCALDVLATISVGNKVESVAGFFASAAL